MCEALIYLLDNIYIRFGTKLYRQTVGIPMGTNCAPLVADLFLFCYERDFMTSLSGVYISKRIRFNRVSSHVADFNTRNKSVTAKLLQQGYRYHKLRKTFSKFYRRHYELVSKFSVALKPHLHQGLSKLELYDDLVYKFKNNEGRADFSDQFRKIIVRYKRIGYNINIMRQSACLVFNHRHKAIYFSWLGPELFCPFLGPPGFNCWFSFAPVFQWCCSTPQGSPGVGHNTFLLSPDLCFITVFICDLFVSRDGPLMS